MILALLSGIIAIWLLHRKYFRNFWDAVSEGTVDALTAIWNMAAVVGFRGVAKIIPSFHTAVDFMTSIPGYPLIGGALAVMIIAGLTSSLSGRQSVAFPILAPHYLDMKANTETLH